MTESSLVVKSKYKTKIFSPLVTLSLILAGAFIIGTTVMPSEMVNGQNATGQNATGQNATGQNATGQLGNASAIDQVDSDVLQSLAASGYAAELSGDNELPPVNTEASGTFTILGNDQILDYQLNLSGGGMTDITGANIRLGDDDEIGKVVVAFGKSVLSPGSPMHFGSFRGSFNDFSLEGPLANHTLAQLIEFMEDGDTYVNVETAGFPSGEIRGQIEQSEEEDEEDED